MPPQEATSASLAVDEKVREDLEARRERAKADFLLGRDEKEEPKTEPEEEQDPCQESKPKSPPRKKSAPPPPPKGRAYNSALAGRVALEREALSRLPPPRSACAVVEVSFAHRESGAPKRDTKVGALVIPTLLCYVQRNCGINQSRSRSQITSHFAN